MRTRAREDNAPQAVVDLVLRAAFTGGRHALVRGMLARERRARRCRCICARVYCLFHMAWPQHCCSLRVGNTGSADATCSARTLATTIGRIKDAAMTRCCCADSGPLKDENRGIGHWR
eukprot:12421452-Alexandrium_andersonii.AAC.1